MPKIVSVGGPPQIMLQVMVQTPSGETMPVTLPAAVVAPEVQQQQQQQQQQTRVVAGVRQTSSSQVSSTTGSTGGLNASSLTKRVGPTKADVVFRGNSHSW